VDTTSSAKSLLKTDSEAYEDALDSIRLFCAHHPEWRQVLKAIETYVASLEESVGKHEPGT
jgi:hypothetical protein